MSWNEMLSDCLELETKFRNMFNSEEGLVNQKVTALMREKASWMEEYFEERLTTQSKQISQTISEFLIRIFTKNETGEIYILDHKVRDTTSIPVANMPEDKKCNWHECEQTESLQKDHILPARCLVLNERWKNEKFNVQWLCQYHNRLKTNSIGIGMAMIGFYRQD